VDVAALMIVGIGLPLGGVGKVPEREGGTEHYHPKSLNPTARGKIKNTLAEENNL